MAVSALIALDLSKKRVKDYKFSWERALASSSKLQYSHARLFSLIDACSPLLTPLDEGNIATETLTEPEALELAFQIGRWEEVLSLAATTLEPQHIVTYLFSLASSSSKALGALQVLILNVRTGIRVCIGTCKNMDLSQVKTNIETEPELSRARILLFACAKKVLGEGMKVLGIIPLDQV